MSRPNPQQTAAMSAAISGAVDLSGLKARAEAAARPQPAGGSTTGARPAATTGAVIEVTEQSFQADVVERSMTIPVVVDLWATWCQPCKQLSPILERLAAEAGGAWVLAKVDVDANPRIMQLFGAQSVPTVVAIAGGQPVTAFSGAQPEGQVRQWIASILDALRDQMPAIAAAEAAAGAPTPDGEPEELDDPRFTAAEAALDAGDYAGAQAAYEQILAVEPANAEAQAALVQVRFLARAEQADPTAIGRADAAPDDVDAQLAAADAEIAGQDVDAAFDRLVATVRRVAGDDRNRVRAHLVELFELFPADDARVALARRALARALF